MVKITKKLFAVQILILCIMTITVNAAITDGIIPYSLPNYITGTYGHYTTGEEDRYFARAYTTATIGIRVPKDNNTAHVPYISRLCTGLQTGKLYKWQYTFDENIVTGVGDIAPTNNSYIAIVTPASLSGHNIDPYLDASLTFATEENPYRISGYTYSIPTDNYRMFYDSNNKTMTCIMILPDGYFDGQEALQMHSYLMVALGEVANTVTENFTVVATDSIPIHVQGDYTALLKEISTKIENLGMGGLTPEHITESIQQALRDHDLQVEEESGGKLQELTEQIEQFVQPYKDSAELVMQSFDGITQILSSTHTDATLVFPAGYLPDGTQLWKPYYFNMAYYWKKLPQEIRNASTVTLTATVMYQVLREMIFVISWVVIGTRREEEEA